MKANIDMQVIELFPGEAVYCDFCDTDYTNNDKKGGLLFGTKATCPDCEKEVLRLAAKYDELKFIKARCPAHLSFRDWVYTLR